MLKWTEPGLTVTDMPMEDNDIQRSSPRCMSRERQGGTRQLPSVLCCVMCWLRCRLQLWLTKNLCKIHMLCAETSFLYHRIHRWIALQLQSCQIMHICSMHKDVSAVDKAPTCKVEHVWANAILLFKPCCISMNPHSLSTAPAGSCIRKQHAQHRTGSLNGSGVFAD